MDHGAQNSDLIFTQIHLRPTDHEVGRKVAILVENECGADWNANASGHIVKFDHVTEDLDALPTFSSCVRAKCAEDPLCTLAIRLFLDSFRAFNRLKFIDSIDHELNANGERARKARARWINCEVMESFRRVVATISDVLDPVMGRRWAAKFLDQLCNFAHRDNLEVGREDKIRSSVISMPGFDEPVWFQTFAQGPRAS